MNYTIQAFSAKTGLPASTLRFYDQKQVLNPQRLDNGYRVYSDDQIKDALMIHSLRQAEIKIEHIKEFLKASDEERSELISKWTGAIESRLASLQVAKKYLGQFGPTENQIHLTRWEEPTTLIWFKHTVHREANPFQAAMVRDKELLEKWGIKTSPGIFVRTTSSKGNELSGEVGFCINQDRPSNHKLKEYASYIETLEPTLFATMECSTQDEFLCFQYIQMLRKYGFEPSGDKFERYDRIDKAENQTFTYFIALLKV
ncbi:hypothetical protein GCM10008967_13280 [Bacillus carboniphilus]|uniref:HTH merR-type domain-containing protein n=1 Tax=Bacillus carboniphilus TaxID=86663 RepID=A0ABN0W3F8_9BACI